MKLHIHVLVVEPKQDPELEREVRRPGFDVHFARDRKEVLDCAAKQKPQLVILSEGPETWPLIAEIWDTSADNSNSPRILLLANDATDWHVDHFGPVLVADRRQFRQIIDRVLLAVSHRGSPISAAEEAEWLRTRDTAWAKGNERFAAEQNRLRLLGLLDEGGRPTSREWPADMKPDSTTDVGS